MKINKLLILFLFFALRLSAQYERGLLPVKNYGPKDYSGLQQTFDIQVDSRSVVYVANGVGLLELSGNSWKKYSVDNKSNVRTIAIDSAGRIFVGAHGEFGYFGIDSLQKGILTYYNLSDKIKNTDDADFSNVKFAVIHNHKVYFQSNYRIFIWNYDSIQIIRSKDRLGGFVKIGNQLLTIVPHKGLFEMGDSLSMLRAHKKGKNVADFTINFNKEYDLALNAQMGFNFIKKRGKKFVTKPFHTQIDSLLHKVIISDFIRINDELMAVGTSRGVFILDFKGRLKRILNKNTGLISNQVTRICYSSDGHLWIATEEGVSSVSLISPLEFFKQEKCGFEGRILNLRRFAGNIFIITNSGLYFLDQNTTRFPKMISTVEQSEKLALSAFRPYIKEYSKKLETLKDTLSRELVNSCWGLAEFSYKDKKLLMVATQDYIVGVNPNGKLEKLAKCYPYVSYQSKVDPRRVFIGLDGGLQSIYYDKNGKWIDEGTVEGINEIIVDMTEDTEGNLWMGSMQKGVIRLQKPVFENHKIKNPKIAKLDKGLDPGSLVMLGKVDDKVLFPSSFGIFQFDAADTAFVYDNSFGPEINNKKNIVFDISQDPLKNIWSIVIEDSSQIANVFYSKKTAENKYHSQKIFSIKSETIFSFFHDSNNITWFGGTFGLSRANVRKFSDKKLEFHTFLTMVLSNSDTAFGGYYYTDTGVSFTQPESYIRTYNYQHNSFTFYFSSSSPVDQKKLKYSWYLEGYEKEQNWGPWSDKTYKEYTNLYEGDYVFHVRSKDVYGNISDEASYSFSIAPPWYRTIWAFIGYILFFIAFVWGAIRVSTRSLKRIIKEATAEIRQQKNELEEKNRNIIDSIRYAQRIQQAVTPSEHHFHRVFSNSFTLWKPRDIVSGDFYWMMEKDDYVYVCAADCTGHGVPGAFMSIMGISFLNQIVGMGNVHDAADVLDKLRHNVITSLNKEGSEATTKDGMDISLCRFDMKNMRVDFAGAYNPLYIIRDGELIETKADRMPIGVHDRDNTPFTNNTVDLQEGDQLYMFSDGYIDQFGGPKGKKFMSKRFKRLLLEVSEEPMEKQSEIIWQRLLEWRGEIEQLDDIIILGIRV